MTTFREDSDERGLWLVFNIDDVCGSFDDMNGTLRISLSDYFDQVELVKFVDEHVKPQVAEYEAHRALYAVTRHALDADEGYALDDPKHSTYRERMVDAGDLARKRERES